MFWRNLRNSGDGRRDKLQSFCFVLQLCKGAGRVLRFTSIYSQNSSQQRMFSKIPLSRFLMLLTNIYLIVAIKSAYCQARVQVPNPLSQQARNPDPKFRPSVKTQNPIIWTGADTIITWATTHRLTGMKPKMRRLPLYNYSNLLFINGCV